MRPFLIIGLETFRRADALSDPQFIEMELIGRGVCLQDKESSR
jgi:hypothetical protein